MDSTLAPWTFIFFFLLSLHSTPASELKKESSSVPKTPINQILLPEIIAEDLNEKEFNFPKDLKTGLNIVLFGFSKSSQESLNRCAQKIEDSKIAATFSIAHLEGVPFFLKGLIKSSIRNSVDANRRSRYLIFTDKKDELKKLAHFDSLADSDTYVLGVKRVENQTFNLEFEFHSQCAEKDWPKIKELLARYPTDPKVNQ